MTFGSITVDLEAQRVTRHGEPVHLTPTEYNLLRQLLRNAGRIVTKEQLLAAAGLLPEKAVDDVYGPAARARALPR